MKYLLPCFVFLFSACQNSVTQSSVDAGVTTNNFVVDASADVASPSTPTTVSDEKEPCQDHMVKIEGNYCTSVEQECKVFLDDPKKTKFRPRCKEFYPSKCTGDKVHMSYCIDKEEFATNYEGLPVSDVSWTQAKNICEANGKRLCSEEEWTFACEGEEMNPYITGNTRPSDACNIDVSEKTVCGKELCDHRNPIEDNSKCVSVFGIHNMTGNVDEWVEVPIYQHSKVNGLFMRSGLKGGHWLPVRNRCRPITKDHDEYYHQISIGFRCCKNL